MSILQRQPATRSRRTAPTTGARKWNTRAAEQRAAAFSDLGRKLSAVRTAKDAAKIIADTADVLCGWDAFLVDLCGPGRNEAVTVFCIDTINGRRVEVTEEVTLGQPGPGARKALLKGPQLILRSPGEKGPLNGVPFGDKNRLSASLMYVPVRRNSEAIGVLSIQSYTPRAYDRSNLKTLQALGDHCGGALERIRATQENDRLQRELRQRAEELERVNSELEHRVRERTAQLEAINKELEAFCYSVSHDLRAPLRSIRGFSEVLLERYGSRLDQRGLEYLRRACDASQQMDKLIEDLLQLSRVARMEMQRQRVNLSALAAAIGAELHKAEPERNVEFIIAEGISVLGDERLLRVVLENLLRNAWKFTSKRPTALIEFGLEPGQNPVFYVRDNGAGFDPAQSSKLFGVFQRLHSANEFPGTGVGLAIVQRIINRHGGRVWASANLDHGATFSFSLATNGN
jgi:signal transduction histidine kinase